MTETKPQAQEPRKPEKVYDDWQMEAIERVTGKHAFINSRAVFLTDDCLVPMDEYDMPCLFIFDEDSREGFQAAFKEWSDANEEIEPPF